jgi:CheY-like chemotaxis protein
MKILLAEDDITNRTLLFELLKHLGTIDVAEDGSEAENLFLDASSTAKPYNLICLDINMPVKHGLDVLEMIRQTESMLQVRRKAVILMTTGMRDRETVIASIRKGCNGYLLKPIDPKKLYELMNSNGLSTDLKKQTKIQSPESAEQPLGDGLL